MLTGEGEAARGGEERRGDRGAGQGKGVRECQDIRTEITPSALSTRQRIATYIRTYVCIHLDIATQHAHAHTFVHMYDVCMYI